MADVEAGRVSTWTASIAFELLPDGCAYKRVLGGETAWTVSEQLLVHHLHTLQIANWQRSSDGTKSSRRPKRIEPPEAMFERERKQDELLDRVRRHEARKADREARRAASAASPTPD